MAAQPPKHAGPVSGSLSTPAPVRSLASGASSSSAVTSTEAALLQAVPKNAAVLELLPRGDVFAAHKLATATDVPSHIREKLALFEQSFSVLKFPHKAYTPVVLDPPTFKQTFHTDTLATAPGSTNAVRAPLQRAKGSELAVDTDGPSSLKSATVADVFDSLGVDENAGRARNGDRTSSNPPLPEGYSGAVPISVDTEAAPAAAPAPDAAAVVLRSYYPNYNWCEGAEVALCERTPLAPPTRANGPSIRFLLHAKALQLGITSPSHGHEIEPFFCELAVYNTSPESRGKLSDTFSVQLSDHTVVDRLVKGRKGKSRCGEVSPFVPSTYVNSTSHSPCTRALFSLPAHGVAAHNKSSVVLVLLVYKVMQGKMDSALDLYAKGADVKEKDIRAMEAKTIEASVRWPDHRQLMMWSAAPLFTEGGGLAPVEFKELYRQPKPEEPFTLQTLTDAAATLISKKKNPANFKQIPGQFVCSLTSLPGSRPAAIAEAERIAPVFNSQLVPVRMEEVLESTETISVGHEMLVANAVAAATAITNATIEEAGETPPTVTRTKSTDSKRKLEVPGSARKHARDRSIHQLVGATLAEPACDPFAGKDKDAAAAEDVTPSEPATPVAPEEWVEVDVRGLLARKSSVVPVLAVSVSSEDGAPITTTAVTAEPVATTPMSPTSRALVKLEHTRPRSYVPLPNGASMSETGYIIEVDPVAELGLHASGSGSSSSASSSAASTTLQPPTTPTTPSSASAASAAASVALAHSLVAESDSSPFHLHYTNQMYVYPQAISFADSRNVVISVQVKDTHESASEPGLSVIYPRADEQLNGVALAEGADGNGKTVGGFVSQTFTAATYHCYNAAFMDEIRIELPLVLKPSHHLLFTFYNVSCKDKVIPSKEGSGNDRTLLGYSLLPLYLDNRITDEAYTLPVCAKLRPHYLLQKDEWDNRKTPLFTVRLRVNSSLYTNDPFLNRFFLKCAVPYLTGTVDTDGASSTSAIAAALEDASPTKRRSDTMSGTSDDLLAMMLRKTLRSGQLKKKGGLKWADRWWSLGDSNLIVHKSHREAKVWHHTAISMRTHTLRNGATKADDELRYAWTIRADGVPSELVTESVPEMSTSSGGVLSPAAEDLMSPASAVSAASPTPANGAAGAATTASPATPRLSASPTPALRTSVASPPATAQSGGSMSSSGGLDPESFENEMVLVADSEDEMFSWLKAIAHAKIAKWSVLESVRGVREAQGELLVRHLPMIMRQLLGVICCPESAADPAALEGGPGALERMKQTAFETMLEVASLVEQGTPASAEKMRNQHLDSWCQFIFDDNSSALPVPKRTVTTTGSPDADGVTPAPVVSDGPKVQRIRSYEAVATFWLQLLKGTASGAAASPTSSSSASGGATTPGGSSSRTLAPLREHAARYSWLLLDMIMKSLLLSTAGHRERRVSMSLGGGAFGSSVPARGGSAAQFFKPATLKLLTDLVAALTQEIFFLATISLSLSKALNKTLALFLRDAFYVFPKTVVFDWISLYLMVSFKLEPTRAGAGGSNSSTRFKYTALQIIADHEHYVSYNVRPAAFVGESKTYMQTAEFGDWSMGDYMNQPPREKEKPADNKEKTEEKKVDEKEDPLSPSGSISPPSGALSPPSGTGWEKGKHRVTASMSVDETSSTGGKLQRSSSDMDQLSPMRMGMAHGRGASTSSAGVFKEPSAPAGHFLPFVLIKQVWLAFRQLNPPANASLAAAVSATIAQEQALSQAAYTLRSVLLKHENDARYQGAKKRSIVAAMYVRILPCLWNNLDKLRVMRLTPPGVSHPQAKAAADGEAPKGQGAPASSPASAARKDLIACALYVLNNLSAPELLRHLRESEYRIHASNIRPWFFQFVELLSLVLETAEYAGPLMRRLETLTNSGGAIGQLSTTLCARMMVPMIADAAPLSDWGGAEDIGGARLGGGGLSALESKYTRNRTNTQLQGHRKSMAAGAGGTMKRRDVQLSSNQQASERQRIRLANRTMTSKTTALLDGGDAQFQAITGIDPSIQRWEKLYAHEASGIVLHILTHVLLPITQENLVAAPDMQDRLMWFVHGFLRLNQSDQMLVQWFGLLSSLLDQHASLVWPLSSKPLDGHRCSSWWFELLRHLSFHSEGTRAAASSFIYQVFLSLSHAIGSTTRLQVPLRKAFARVMDTLRNRTSEDGNGAFRDALGWTILQTDSKVKEPVNDAAYTGVLLALAKSCTAIANRAASDPKRADSAVTACLQDIETSFQHLNKIIETSALIHTPRASTMDPDSVIESTQAMLTLYKRAPRVRLLYMKHLYDLHMVQNNNAEAGATQLRMFRLIHRQSAKINSQGRLAANSAALWNSDHALSCLRKASELFEAAELYEQALHCENYAISHWVVRKQPALVVPHSRRLVVLWEKLATLATLGDTRSFGTYYRVGFYGAAFRTLGMDGREFVYREPNLTKLPEITSRLVALWTSILGREVTVFKDSGVIDRAALGNDTKLQVTAVLPFFKEDSLATPPPPERLSLVHPPTAPMLDAEFLVSRQDHFERNTALRSFYYDTPYVPGGKSHGSVETQWKKRSLISLAPTDSFPSFLRRLPVASRTELNMSPLQCVLEDVHKRVHKLFSEARPALGNPDLKTLTQVLSGSVNVQVNGGTAEVCQVFLSPENCDKWDQAELAELRIALGTFVKASGEALQVAVELANATSENKAFIEILELGYQALVASVRAAVPDLAL